MSGHERTSDRVGLAYRTSLKKVLASLPVEGTLIVADAGTYLRLRVDCPAEQNVLMYATLYVPTKNVPSQEVTWHGRAFGSTDMTGVKAIVLPRNREHLLRRYPALPRNLPVRSVRVIRHSSTGKSVLVEVEASGLLPDDVAAALIESDLENQAMWAAERDYLTAQALVQSAETVVLTEPATAPEAFAQPESIAFDQDDLAAAIAAAAQPVTGGLAPLPPGGPTGLTDGLTG